ncbi:hypothetical protein APHAL10511_000722 [Amanita phalloides]|nr:hypothetical protein APHAL10511_000722 [Amanita phalloides]
MDVDGSDGDTLQEPERQDLQSCSSDGLDNGHFDAPHVDQKQTAMRPQRATFPRLNQSQPYNSLRPVQPADIFRKQFQQRTQPQPQQHPPFFNLLNTINTIRGESSNSKPRQPENTRSQNVFQQSPVASLGLLAHGKGAYTNPRTPAPPPVSVKHITIEDGLSRERELSAMPSTSGVDLEMEALTMKVWKEKRALKAELVQVQTHVQNLTRRLADVEEEFAVSSTKNVEQDKHVETLKHELSSVCKELSSARTELLSAKATLDSHQRDLTSTKGDLMTVRNQNVVLASTNQELERYQDHVKAKLDVTQKALIALKNDYATLFMSFTDLKRLHDSAAATISNLSDGVAECRKSANDALRKIETTYQDPNTIMGTAQVRAVLDDLRDTLSESSRTNDLLRDKLHHHLGQIVELNDRIKELESEKRELLNLLVVQKEQETVGQKLGMRMEELSDRLAKREAEVEIATADAVTLKAELRASESRISDLDQQIADDAVKLELLKVTQQEYDGAKIENEMLKKVLAAKDDRLIALEQSISLTAEQRDECRNMLGNVENELALARMESESGKKLIQQLQVRLSDSRTALSHAAKDAEIVQLRATSDLEQALKARQETIVELKHTISAKGGEYKSVETSLDKARREISEKETLLKQARAQFNKLEERFDAQSATLRLSKEQCGDLQEQLQASERNFVELRVEIATLHHQLETHQDTANELKAVKGLLAEKDLALTRTIDDLRDLQGRYDTQTKDLRAITREQALLSADKKNLEKDLDTHKSRLAEKERLLAESASRTSVFQERLDAQKVALQVTREQLESLQERIIRSESKHAAQLESEKEKLKAAIAVAREQHAGLQTLLNQAREDAVEQRTLLDERLSREEKANERLLEVQQRRAEVAENAASEAKLNADMLKKELDVCLRRQKESQSQLELTEQGLRDTQSSLQNALAQTQTIRDQIEQGNKERIVLLDKISTMEAQMASFREANQCLMHRSKTLQDRYENGDLSDQERSFVNSIVSTTQSIHENELLEKMNELRRRDAVNSTLQERIKTLESTIARMLRERGTEIRPEVKSLVNLSLWMSSSPQDGLNSVDMQIPTVDPLLINARTSAPKTPRDETTLVNAEMENAEYAYGKDDKDNMKQVPKFSNLCEPDSGDDDIPLSELGRLSPSPAFVQGVNKRGRAASPAATNMGRPTRRMKRGSGTAPVADQVVKSPKASRKSAPTTRQKKQK